MLLTQSWRWYGPNDIISLQDIEQTGASGVVHALHGVPVGEVWELEDIQARKNLIEWNEETHEKRNLKWVVVESLNVHESIRQGREERNEYIKKYIQSLRNLSECGLKIVCYNFMPLLDWTRTDLRYEVADSSLALRFDWDTLIAFDLYVLKRESADFEYSELEKKQAKALFDSLNKEQVKTLTDTILQGVPGTSKVFTLNEFKELLHEYDGVRREDLKENLRYFLKQVIPEAEKLGIKLCCHPDDPPFPLFGIPRIISTEEDLKYLINCVDSPSNGVTFCTGSLGPNIENDLPGIIERLRDRIHFIHLRNIQREEGRSFYEADHLDGSVDMFEVMKALVIESKRRKELNREDYSIPYRPDHGHQMLDDLNKDIPFHGYSAIGRMRGLAELRGLELGISRAIEK
ncbi:MAG: mannonate dehydratase [Balneolaceae bacterium]